MDFFFCRSRIHRFALLQLLDHHPLDTPTCRSLFKSCLVDFLSLGEAMHHHLELLECKNLKSVMCSLSKAQKSSGHV